MQDGAEPRRHRQWVFTVVRGSGDALEAVPYPKAYGEEMTAISTALGTASQIVANNPKEAALVTYLKAAADSFQSNNWEPADVVEDERRQLELVRTRGARRDLLGNRVRARRAFT